jgi:hypothetical protein
VLLIVSVINVIKMIQRFELAVCLKIHVLTPLFSMCVTHKQGILRKTEYPWLTATV